MIQKAEKQGVEGRMREAAFVGWQVASAVGGGVGDYGAWLKRLGLHPTESKGASKKEVETSKKKAADTFARAREAFKRGAQKAAQA